MPVVSDEMAREGRRRRRATVIPVISALLLLLALIPVALATTGLQIGSTYVLLYAEGDGPVVRGPIEPVVWDEQLRGRNPELVPGPWGRTYRIEGPAHARGLAFKGGWHAGIAWFRGRRL